MVRSIINKETQIKVYKKYKDNIFQVNGKALPYSNEIYKTLEMELEGMNPKCIQTNINRHVKEILSNDEVNGETNDNNDDCMPTKFVSVIMGLGDNRATEASSLMESYSTASLDNDSLNGDLYELYHSKTLVNNTQDQMNWLESVEKAKKCFAKITQQSGNEKLGLNRLKEEYSELLSREASTKTENESLRNETARLEDEKLVLDRLKEENFELLRREASTKTENESLRNEIANSKRKMQPFSGQRTKRAESELKATIISQNV